MILAAAGYGTLGVVSRFAGEAGVGALAFVAWRGVLGAILILAPLLLMARLGRASLVAPSAVSRLARVQLMAVAGFSTATNVAIFLAFERTTIALVLICFYTYPVLVAVANAKLHGEHLDRVRTVALILASSGMLLLVAAPMVGQSGVSVDPVGVALGLAAAVLQTGYALITGRGFSAVPATLAAALLTGLTAVMAMVIVLLAGVAPEFVSAGSDPAAWPWLLAAASLGAAIPTVFVVAGYRRIGSTRASILMLFEPVVAVILAALFVAERPAPLQLVGGLLVLAGAAYLQVAPARSRLAVEPSTGP